MRKQSLVILLNALLLVGCQTTPQASMPQQASTSGASAGATPPPGASAACEINVPTPMPQPSYGDGPIALAQNGMDSVPGLQVSADGTSLTPQVAHLYIQAYPGSGQMRVTAARVTFRDAADPTALTASATVPIDPAVVPAAPQGGGYGANVAVSVPLPAGLLKPYFAQVRAKGQPLPSAINTQVDFVDDGGNLIQAGPYGSPLFAFDLPTGSAGTDRSPVLSPCTTDPGPQPPNPVIGENGATVYVADEIGFSPKDGLSLSNGALSASSVSVTLQAAPGSAAIAIASEQVTFSWLTSANQPMSSAPKSASQAATLPAGNLTTAGTPATVAVPLDASGLGNLGGAGLAVAHVKFTDKNGNTVLDRTAVPLDVQIPILVK